MDYLSDKDASSVKFLMKLDFSCGIVDILVVDNFAAGDAELALQSLLNDVGLELLYLPAYSPDLNPDGIFFKAEIPLKIPISRYACLKIWNMLYGVQWVI